MATRTYDRLQLNSGSTYTLTAGDVIVILNYVDGDWNGAIIQSDTPASSVKIVMPNDITVTGCTFTDIDASDGGVIDASDGSSTDGGGNTNITFPTVTASSTIKRSYWFNRRNWRF